jgi:hypothetical protein
MRFCPFKRKPRVAAACRTVRNYAGNPESDNPRPAGRTRFSRLALIVLNQILPYGRVIRSRMKPAADELTGVSS